MAKFPLRLLCLGDNHGNTTSLERVVSETEGESFDYIIHVGDITNTLSVGIEEGVMQLKRVEPLFESLEDRGNLVYIWGNRDSYRGDHVADHYHFGCGTHVPSEEKTAVNGVDFTGSLELVDENTILVTHGLRYHLLDTFEGLAYFSGHVHSGRYKNNSLNTAFLYRDDLHSAKPMEGGYFFVEVAADGIASVEPRLWNLKEGGCTRHICKGIQYIPEFWREDCQFCYDESEFFEELVNSALNYFISERDIDPKDVLDPVRGPSVEKVNIELDEVFDIASTFCSEKPPRFDERLNSFIKGTFRT